MQQALHARAEIDKRVAEALELVGLSHLFKRMPSQLSGSQQQRVAVARDQMQRQILGRQLAGQRALEGGQTLLKTLDMVKAFRKTDTTTPIVLMGYYNPIYSHGVTQFLADAMAAGIDGLIVVDLPPEEDDELCIPAQAAGLNFIRLATPTTDAKRLPKVLENTSGFVYYVSITGITGAAAAQADAVAPEVARIKAATDLPVIVGFGIRTPDTAQEIAAIADGCVVGSAIVAEIAAGKSVDAVLAFVKGLAAGAHRA